MLESILQDVRYGWRLLRRSPLFTLTSALSLAIGIGANTTIFSAASAMLFRPLPGLEDPARLVDIARTQNGKGFDNSSYPNFRDLRARVTTMTDVYAIKLEAQPMGLGGQDGAERIYGAEVSANYFTVLGTKPVLGRLLIDDDDRGAGDRPVLVLSHELWMRRFAGDRDIVGRTVPINGHPFTIVGVAPAGFQGTTVMRSDVWVPLSATILASPRRNASIFESREAVWLMMGGRLKPGVSIAQANAEVAAIGAGLEREYPRENRGKSFKAMDSAVVPGNIDVFAGFLALLMGIVGLVLLIACVNLSGMLLARAAARQREIAVRLAIGASRWRLARQMIAETSLLFVAGGVLGVVLSIWLRGLLLSVLPALPVPVGLEMPLDLRVLAFAIVASLVAAILSGLAPALHTTNADLVPALKADSAQSGGRIRLRSAFLVGQVALSLLLVLTAGLFLRSLSRFASAPTGFDQAHVDVVVLDLSLANYTDATGPQFARHLLSRVSAQPGVRHAALAADLPLDGNRKGFGSIRTPGLRRGDSEEVDGEWNVITPGYFSTLNLPLVRGRDFTETDVSGAPRVAIVNESMARFIWGTPDVIGRTLQADDGGSWETLTIVGVTSDARLDSLDGEVGGCLYVPFAQRYTPRVSLVIKNSGPTAVPIARSLIHQLDPDLPVTQAVTLADVTALSTIPQRLAAAVAGSLGIVGLLLAAIGIYGVTSYSVNRRVREIGVRMALGADRGSVLRLVLRQGLGVTTIGIAIGLVAGAGAAHVVRSLLFGVSALDPVTFVSGAAMFLAVAVGATLGPARRATKIDPMVALRAD
jgi:predicted permease